MSDQSFWNFMIVGVTLASLGFCYWLVIAFNRAPKGDHANPEDHVWDEDLSEANNPLPRWWVGMFLFTIFFSVAYLLLYPGLGVTGGFLQWTQTSQYEEEMRQAEAQYGPIFERFRATPIDALAENEEAMQVGERLFASYCSMCHGSDARGAPGYPNLRDSEWLWGGSPEEIRASIMNGRTGAMPGWAGVLPDEKAIEDVAAYVLAMREPAKAESMPGKQHYQQYCVACHMADGTGNKALGAPNLVDKVWLYGSSQAALIETIAKGRTGRMPANGDFLGEDKVHVLSAYVYGIAKKAAP
jgi:cytochrome c oxidase cbb3-type subunit 3